MCYLKFEIFLQALYLSLFLCVPVFAQCGDSQTFKNESQVKCVDNGGGAKELEIDEESGACNSTKNDKKNKKGTTNEKTKSSFGKKFIATSCVAAGGMVGIYKLCHKGPFYASIPKNFVLKKPIVILFNSGRTENVRSLLATQFVATMEKLFGKNKIITMRSDEVMGAKRFGTSGDESDRIEQKKIKLQKKYFARSGFYKDTHVLWFYDLIGLKSFCALDIASRGDDDDDFNRMIGHGGFFDNDIIFITNPIDVVGSREEIYPEEKMKECHHYYNVLSYLRRTFWTMESGWFDSLIQKIISED